MGTLQVEQKSETAEVPFDIIVARIPFLKCQVGGKLRLGRRSKPDRNRRDPDLRTLGVKVSAESLKMGTY
jgi:hypothetical protein